MDMCALGHTGRAIMGCRLVTCHATDLAPSWLFCYGASTSLTAAASSLLGGEGLLFNVPQRPE